MKLWIFYWTPPRQLEKEESELNIALNKLSQCTLVEQEFAKWIKKQLTDRGSPSAVSAAVALGASISVSEGRRGAKLVPKVKGKSSKTETALCDDPIKESMWHKEYGGANDLVVMCAANTLNGQNSSEKADKQFISEF